MMDGETDCNGEYGFEIFNPNKTRGVIDDHVPAHEAGIPAINFIDINYGEDAERWGGYWHTHEDTADKVSAESLGLIGNILEIGLRPSAWTLEPSQVNNDDLDNDSNLNSDMNLDDSIQKNIEKSRTVGYISIIIVSFILVLILMADISLKL